MKRLNAGVGLALFVSLLISVGCASSGSTSGSEQIGSAYNTNYWTLEDFLRRASSVQLHGQGDNIRVTIRGNNSLGNPGNQPLYIVDGQKAGRDFAQVSSMFAEGDIISVIVHPAGSSSRYGMEGNYGVIVIKSRLAASRSL